MNHRCFTCEVCKEHFRSNPDFTVKDQEDEQMQNFGAIFKEEDLRSVCDDCYLRVMAGLELLSGQ